jgi:hypothetical protein
MKQWWARNNDVLPNDYTQDDLETFKSEVEDLTGCIPLLLDKCKVNGKIDLSAPALRKVFEHVQFFMDKIQREQGNTLSWIK